MTAFALPHKKIWIAGHRGMVGSALVHRLQREDCQIITNRIDLRNQTETEDWLTAEKPDAIILAAAKVGGIAANAARPADFLYDNLMIEANVIHSAYKAGVKKLLFLGSSCIYPKHAPQPIPEDALLTGPLEPTNEAYAIAKIAGLKLCAAYRKQHGCDFIAAMPCNLYGPGDSFDPEHSHVIPALILKMEQARTQGAKTIELWGTGTPRREFLYVDDLADALILLLKQYSDEKPINIGSGKDLPIAALAQKIATATGYEGEITFNPSHPDGTPRKLMDNTRIKKLGWCPETSLDDGLAKAVAWYREHHRRRQP